jgi:hypothetical protein
LLAPRWTGEAVLVAFDKPAEAADAALSVAHTLAGCADLRIAGHYGIVRCATNPFGGEPILAGAASALPAKMIHSTPRRAIHVTEDFADALCAGSSSVRFEFVGELPGSDIVDPTKLFSLRR